MKLSDALLKNPGGPRLTDRILAEGRDIFDVTLVPEVRMALAEWIRQRPGGTVIGGCCRGLYGRPRTTVDVDVLFMSEGEIPERVSGFSRTRKRAFTHERTRVEVEVFTPEFLGIPVEVVAYISRTAAVQNGVKIASLEGFVVAKLCRGSHQDLADIEDVALHNEITLDQIFDAPLTAMQRQILSDLIEECAEKKKNPRRE